METKTVTQIVTLNKRYSTGSDDYILSATLTWVNGKFNEISIRNDVCGFYIFISHSSVMRLGANGLIALRELMQEVATITNNPPDGCESV